MPAKSEQIGHDDIQIGFTRVIRYVVKIALRILILQVNRWCNGLVLQAQPADNRFNAAGAPSK